MKIQLTTVTVTDQDQALRFYTEVLGCAPRADVRQGNYRWLTVTAPDAPAGPEVLLALDDGPESRAAREARAQGRRPALLLLTDDLDADHARIAARGGVFAVPPMAVTGARIAMLEDTCGNLVQLTQLRAPSA